MSNFTAYPTAAWLDRLCQMSEQQACQAVACALLQAGCHHPNERTFKETTGLVLWAVADPNAMPAADRSFAALTRIKGMVSFERTRMQMNVAYYLSFPGPAQFRLAHPEAYALAFGEGDPAGIPEVLAHRTPQLLFYITAGVPLRKSSRHLRGDAGPAPVLGRPGPPGAPQSEMGQLVAALTQMVTAFAQPGSAAPAPARLTFMKKQEEETAARASERAAQALPAQPALLALPGPDGAGLGAGPAAGLGAGPGAGLGAGPAGPGEAPAGQAL